MGILDALPGWVLLIPFFLLGVSLRARSLFVVTGVLLILDALLFASVIYNPSPPGTYGFYATMGVIVISVAALFVMWLSAGASAVFRRVGSRRPPGPVEFDI